MIVREDQQYVERLKERLAEMPDRKFLELIGVRSKGSDDVVPRNPFAMLDLGLSSFGYAGGEYHKTAAIATLMAPLVSKNLKEGSRVRVVGNDSPNLCAEDYPWKDHLLNWLERGVKVDYLLTAPSQKSLNVLKQLKEKASDHGDGLRVWFVVDDPSTLDALSEVDRQWLERLMETHFAVFENPSQLWLEADHPRESTDANGCVFYGVNSRFGHALGKTLSNRFTYLCESSATEQVL